MPFLLYCRCTFLLGLGLLAAPVAHAQRTADDFPPQAPFGYPTAQELPPGQYSSHSYQHGILTIYATDGSTRQVQPWAAGVTKISYFAPGRQPVADSSLSVVQAPSQWFPPAWFRAHRQAMASGNVQQSGDKLLWLIGLETTQTNGWGATVRKFVVIDKKTLRIHLTASSLLTDFNAVQDTLFSEAAPAYRRQPSALAPTDAETPPSRINELPGTGVRVQLHPSERLYGTGARALPLDRRGYRLELYNQAHYGYGLGEPALNVTLPVVLSSRGYMLLFDHYAAGYLDLGKQHPNALEYGVEGLNSLSYFVITGVSQAEILNRYTALTGRQPLPPRWALGLIQSRFGYRSQAEMLDVARRMRAADFPLDALVLDLYWFGGITRQGDFQWDAHNFPDPAGLMRDLKTQGVNTILISEPYVMRTSANDSLVRTQGLVGTTAAGRPFTVGSFWAGPASILDVFKPEARTWLWAQYRCLHEQGAAGWWSDLGEPENHPLAMHHALGPARQVHNAYGITWAKIFQDNYAKEYPNERLFNLARSGWAGMQRNAVFPWSGDISRTWSGLQAQVPIMLSMGQAGVGYMHSDAGGFGANALRDPELYTRWLQLAALGPILRPHSDQVVPPEPYTYPEPYQSIVRKYTHLRAELLPYLYTLGAENTLTGAPLVRALDYTATGEYAQELREGLAYWKITDAGAAARTRAGLATSTLRNAVAKYPSLANSQFLLGPSLLVAPVSQPGQRRRNVLLPTVPGGWVDVETGQTLPSGKVVGLPAPLGHIPVLARAGAILPTTAYRSSTAAFRPDTLLVRYFPDPAVLTSMFRLYEDDGHSAQALAQHQYATIELHAIADEDNILFQAAVMNTLPGAPASASHAFAPDEALGAAGTYPGAPLTRLVRLCIARVQAPPAGIVLDGKPLATSAWHYDEARHELLVDFTLRKGTTLFFDKIRLLTGPLRTDLDPDPLTLTMPASHTFSTQAELRYERFGPTSASLRIRDARGRLLRELVAEAALGPHALTWDGRDAQGHPVPLGHYDVELAGQHQHLVKTND